METVSESMCSPGTRMRTFTPRSMAASMASRASSSGTKYEAWMSRLCSAAAMAIRYIRCIVAPPPTGELMNICASISPASDCGGK